MSRPVAGSPLSESNKQFRKGRCGAVPHAGLRTPGRFRERHAGASDADPDRTLRRYQQGPDDLLARYFTLAFVHCLLATGSWAPTERRRGYLPAMSRQGDALQWLKQGKERFALRLTAPVELMAKPLRSVKVDRVSILWLILCWVKNFPTSGSCC